MRDTDVGENFQYIRIGCISCDSLTLIVCCVGKSLWKISMCHNLEFSVDKIRQENVDEKKNLNKCHFPYFRAQSGKDYFILSVQYKRRKRKNRSAILYFVFQMIFFHSDL